MLDRISVKNNLEFIGNKLIQNGRAHYLLNKLDYIEPHLSSFEFIRYKWYKKLLENIDSVLNCTGYSMPFERKDILTITSK